MPERCSLFLCNEKKTGNGCFFLVDGRRICFHFDEWIKKKYDYNIIHDWTVYEFYSEGKNGRIRKEIHFELMQKTPSIFNLSVGKLLKDGNIDDKTITGNQDTEKILSVISDAILEFINSRNAALVYVKGSTPSRTRLFQMWIAKVYEQFNPLVWIDGRVKERWIPFKKGIAFEAFLMGRR